MENNTNQESTELKLVAQKLDFFESHLNRLGESHRDLTSKVEYLITIVPKNEEHISKSISTLQKNQATLTTRIWAILSALIVAGILMIMDILSKR